MSNKYLFFTFVFGISILFTSTATNASVATVHQHCNYTGWAAPLEVGSYTLTKLRALGFVNDDASSITVNPGYEVVLYQHDNFSGTSITRKISDSCLFSAGFNDIASSIVVRAVSSSSASSIALSSSSKSSSSSAVLPTMNTLNFTPSSELFPNPERGWIVHRYSNDMWDIASLRGSAEKISLMLLKVNIGAFRDADHISAAKLNEIKAALQLCRDNGIKALMRSAYSFDEVLAPDPADINRMANHVKDMKGIYYDYKDVIIAVEMGMFGPWGEMHSSSQSTISTSFYYPIKTEALKIIHAAYMDALPSDRQVIVRRPFYIREIVGDVIPLNESDAYSGSAKARTGYHNDAYLSTIDESGTFAHGWNRQQELDYIHQMTRFTFFGAETIGTPNGTYNNATNALLESRYQHLTYLHRDYYTPIYDAWGADTKAEFTRNLGYRFALNNVNYTSQVAPGGKLEINFNISNNGFANLYNPRIVELVLENGTQQYRTSISVNPRTWEANGVAQSFTRAFHIPYNITAGTWKVYLALPDASAALKSDARYAIRFANANTWDERGLNLLFNLPIAVGAPGSISNETQFFEIGAVSTPVNSATLSANNLILKGIFTGNLAFHQAYIDADNNPATGLSTQGIGADFLIENQTIYQHTGTGWSWTLLSATTPLVDSTSYTWTLPTTLLNNTANTNSKVLFTESDGSLINIFSSIISVKAN